MGIEIGNEDSVFRELIEEQITHIHYNIDGVEYDLTHEYGQAKRDLSRPIEIAKIHLYVAKVLLDNWKEEVKPMDPHNYMSLHPDTENKK